MQIYVRFILFVFFILQRCTSPGDTMGWSIIFRSQQLLATQTENHLFHHRCRHCSILASQPPAKSSPYAPNGVNPFDFLPPRIRYGDDMGLVSGFGLSAPFGHNQLWFLLAGGNALTVCIEASADRIPLTPWQPATLHHIGTTHPVRLWDFLVLSILREMKANDTDSQLWVPPYGFCLRVSVTPFNRNLLQQMWYVHI